MPYKSITVSDDEFAALFPHHTDQELADLWQTTRAAVYCKARRMGLKKTPEHVARARQLIYESISGERHHLWKGGISAEQRQGRADRRYGPWRDAVRERDHYTCTQCGDRRRPCEMHAHHIKPFADYVALRYDVDNGTTLCLNCHHALHGTTPRPRIQVPCKCGCGTLIDAIDKWGYEREWVNYHYRHTAETRAKISASKRGQKKQRGYRHTPEAKAKIAAAKTGRPRTEAEIAGAVLGGIKRRGREESPQTRANKSASHQGKVLSEAHREAIRAGHERRKSQKEPPC